MVMLEQGAVALLSTTTVSFGADGQTTLEDSRFQGSG